MPTLAIKSGTTAIAGSTVKGSFSYFSGSTKDLGPTSSTGFYSGVDAPSGGYTVYQIGGLNGWTARVATDTTSLNSILISAGATGSTVDQRITWATNTNSVYINSGATLVTYTIGQSALGGVIAYINGGGSTGTSGLVAATSDQSTGVQWWNGTALTITTSTALGTGLANTNAIISAQGAGTYAASISRNYTGGSYSDWYLPSTDELNKLYLNKTAIGGFTNNTYWTSSQWVIINSYAEAQQFNNGNTLFQSTSTNTLYVRAIRSF